jgi:hypothetical protein
MKKFKIEDYRLEPEHLKTLKPGAGVVGEPKARAARPKTVSGIRRKDAFAIVPLWWAARTGNASLMVYADLAYRAWRAKGKTFIMPNIKGVNPKTKIRILRALERKGLIAVEWCARKSPRVTLLVSIF